jgi:hypothetical protein
MDDDLESTDHDLNEHYFGICLEGLGKTTYSFRTAGVPMECRLIYVRERMAGETERVIE